MNQRWRATPPDPLPWTDWSFPTVHRRTLGNGLRLLVARHGSAPLLSLRAIVRSGGSADPEERDGLASLTADLLDEGAGSRDAVALADDLGRLGAYSATGADWDASYVFVESLSDSADQTTRIFEDMVRRPLFTESSLERVVAEKINVFLQQRDDASSVAARLFSRFLFAPSRYGSPLTGDPDSLERITRYDVTGFHSEAYRPGNTSIVATGDLEPDLILDRLSERFGEWEQRSTPERPQEPGPGNSAGEIYLIDRPGSVQSEIRVGHVGVSRSSEDYFPLLVMNAILGDLFNSRMMLNLRERNGYTYGARSSFIFRRHAGPFVVSTAVRNEVTRESVEEILSEIHRIRDSAVLDEEIGLAREYIAGAFPSTVQTGADLARRLQEMELYDLPEDYFDFYRSRIEAVTTEDVSRVARRYLSPDTAIVVIVGAGSEIAETLGQLGRGVRRFDIDGKPLA